MKLRMTFEYFQLVIYSMLMDYCTRLPNSAGWRCTRGRKPNCEPIKENIGTTTYITRIKITLDQRYCLTR